MSLFSLLFHALPLVACLEGNDDKISNCISGGSSFKMSSSIDSQIISKDRFFALISSIPRDDSLAFDEKYLEDDARDGDEDGRWVGELLDVFVVANDNEQDVFSVRMEGGSLGMD